MLAVTPPMGLARRLLMAAPKRLDRSGIRSGAVENDVVTLLQASSPENLFRQHYGRIARSLAMVADDLAAAEDATQEAFVEAFLRWERISRYGNPAAWVRRVALNRLLNRRRSLGRRDVAVRRLGAPEPAPPPSGDSVDVRRALAKLPTQQRIAVLLFHVDQLAIADIAAVMELAEGTVSTHLHRGRERLKALLGEEE